MDADPSLFVLDIGQGACSVIRVDDHHAIVIDCGSSAQEARDLLRDLGVGKIALLVVSHNDRDHADGAPGILGAFAGQVEALAFLQDRPIEDIRWLNKAKQAFRGHPWPRRVRLEVDEQANAPKVLWPQPVKGEPPPERPPDPRLELLYPELGDNMDEQRVGDTNGTSAIVAFVHGNRRVVFGADAPVRAWDAVHARFGQQPCDVLVTPHHGGLLLDTDDVVHERSELERVFRDIVPHEHAVISVGSNNTYSHPRASYVAALKASGCRVFCTQITRTKNKVGNVDEPACADLGSLTAPGILPRADYGIYPGKAVRRARWMSPGLACMGTVVVRLRATGAKVEREHIHAAAVAALAPNPNGLLPLCRREV
ncbi:MAG: MBL fold metallo-hydrolase [bacterium]|nr:MBL fold metallo-hydrolase [bacterium]